MDSTDGINLNPFSGFFWANNPNVNQQLRQRIALQMLSSRKGFPKNFGEGLTAIGDSIGDLGIMHRLEQGDLATQEADRAAAARAAGGGAEPASYAPPERSVSEAPAVRAINAAITPREESAPAPELSSSEQPSSVLSPNTVAVTPNVLGGAAPPMSRAQASLYMDPRRAALPPFNTPPGRFSGPAAGVADAGYNSIDAQAGLPNSSRMPGYMQTSIERTIPNNPDFQAYAGTISAREAPKGPADTSPTGATGPYQFTRGTGRDYGLTTAAARQDPEASTVAFRDFTQDNAETFQRINGRPPTMAELAVMHQQGGQTGANMVAGTGNASPSNLAVNNINPNAGPAQAVAGIKGYYGLPERSFDPRAAATNAMMARQSGPQPNLMPAGPQGPGGQEDQRLALADTNGVRAAPPTPSGLRAIPPPVQVAQAGQPTAIPGYVPPEPSEIPRPPMAPLSPLGQQMLRELQANPNLQNLPSGRVMTIYNNELARQKLEQDQVNEDYKKKVTTAEAIKLKRVEALTDQAKRQVDVAHVQQQIRSGNIIEMPDGNKYRYGEDNVMHPIPIEGAEAPTDKPPQVKMTAEQSKDQKFHGWTSLAEEQMNGREGILANGLQQELAGKVPFVGNKLQQSEYRRVRSAAERFVQGFLRDISGAVISTEELAKHQATFLPRYGDDASVIADKKAARDQIVSGLYAGAGPGQKISDWETERRHKLQAASDAKINDEMKDTPQVTGKVYTNIDPKTKKVIGRRAWTGTRWEDL